MVNPLEANLQVGHHGEVKHGVGAGSSIFGPTRDKTIVFEDGVQRVFETEIGGKTVGTIVFDTTDGPPFFPSF